MKITLYKTNKGEIQIHVLFPFLEVTFPLKIQEARKFAKELMDLVSPQKTYNLTIEDDDAVPDGTYIEASSRALAIHRIVEGATLKLSFKADDSLFDLKDEFDKAFGKILNQEKKILNLGPLPPHLAPSEKTEPTQPEEDSSPSNPPRADSLFRKVAWCCTIQP